MEDGTIASLSSGAVPSGIAVLRVSGPSARLAVLTLCGAVPVPRQASLRTFRDGTGGVIDRGLVLFFEGPRSATGEDLAEFHCHGGRAVVAACLAALTAIPGIRLATAGEYTRRAFENGRTDLTEAEGLADLLAAETEAQRREAVARSGGALRLVYEDWMMRLVRARAFLEASFDFSDEDDVDDDVVDGVRPVIEALCRDMTRHLAGASRGEILRHGFRVAIVGPPNAGKSSLLNALADRDVAIVTDVAGTTRDTLEVLLDLNGIPVRLIDTAGLRESDDAVEMLGIERARAAAANADLLVLVEAGPRGELTHVKQELLGASERDIPTVVVASKSDLASEGFAAETDCILVSVKDGSGLDLLTQRISRIAADALGRMEEAVPMRVRHREIVSDALRILEEFLEADIGADIAAEGLRRASDRLGELTGRVGTEDLLDMIFSQFCIGK